MCHSHPLLPMGLSDVPNIKPVKLYCARCEDIYNPKSSRHASIDGAYFGTSFHNIIFQVYPTLFPAKSAERYVPRVYGFKVHASAALVRWQGVRLAEMRRRLRKMDVESGFKDDDRGLSTSNGLGGGGGGVADGGGGGVGRGGVLDDDDDDDDDDIEAGEYVPEDGAAGNGTIAAATDLPGYHPHQLHLQQQPIAVVPESGGDHDMNMNP